MDADGYGAGLSFDGERVTIRAGKVAARVQHTDRLVFPVADVGSVDFKAAGPMVNGHVRFRMRDTSAAVLQGYGVDQPNTVNGQSFVVHFRRKDNDAFAALRDAIVGALVR
jgi:hypothetical protein